MEVEIYSGSFVIIIQYIYTANIYCPKYIYWILATVFMVILEMDIGFCSLILITCQFDDFFYYAFPGIELEDESENSNLVLAGNSNSSLISLQL